MSSRPKPSSSDEATVELVGFAESGLEVHHVRDDLGVDPVPQLQRVATVRVDDHVGHVREIGWEALLDDLAHAGVARVVPVATLPVEVVVVGDRRDAGHFDDPLERHSHREVTRQRGRVLRDQEVDPHVTQPAHHLPCDVRGVAPETFDERSLVGVLHEERVVLLLQRGRMGEGQLGQHGGTGHVGLEFAGEDVDVVPEAPQDSRPLLGLEGNAVDAADAADHDSDSHGWSSATLRTTQGAIGDGRPDSSKRHLPFVLRSRAPTAARPFGPGSSTTRSVRSLEWIGDPQHHRLTEPTQPRAEE